MAVGLATMTSLEQQHESLQTSEKCLREHAFALEKSKRVLRGMTWSGWITNMLSTAPTIGSAPQDLALKTESEDNEEERKRRDKHQMIEETSLYDPDLTELNHLVSGVHDISLKISDMLDNHSNILEEVQSKTDRVQDETVAVTLKASQLSTAKRYYSKQLQLLGVFQFIDAVSGFYLSLDTQTDGTLLTRRPLESSFFNLYSDKNGFEIFHMQHAQTGKYLGVNMIGSAIRFDHRSSNKNTQCYLQLELQGKSLLKTQTPKLSTSTSTSELRPGVENTCKATGIFNLACNWGNGGWLQASAVPDTETASVSSDLRREERERETERERERTGGRRLEEVMVNLKYTTSISDKSGMLRVHPLKM
eukprot:CAMPEP_0182423212 /NCGR_PEP_ID=MMETSP1167-20130531/9129_1 /TAXON_ID=2988 /ORGANISM="Mallomonas Sp, Strain CCMP3275" /LENGTH=362 /DNA_ID=CAMNT_0024601961 /DNA_START=253 /DNA_END=1341 /DNA_ORIENTATION=-